MALLAQSQASPQRIALDSTYVYWGQTNGAWLMRTLKDGSGSPEYLVSANTPWSVAADATYLYWINRQDANVYRSPKAGGSAIVFATVNTWTHDMTSDGTALFVTAPSVWNYERIWRVDLASGAVVPLAYTGTADIQPAVDGTLLYFKDGVDVPTLNWVDKLHGGSRGQVPFQGPSDGGISHNPNPVYDSPSTIGVDTCHEVFWGAPWVGEIRLSAAPNGSIVAANVLATTVNRLVVDGPFLYWTDASAVGRLPLP
jgi:hypothetical protein